MSYYKRFFRVLMFACLLSLFVAPCNRSLTGAPGMPPMTEEEMKKLMADPEFTQFLNAFEEEFKKLPPEVQEELNKQAMEDLKKMGIDPNSLQPMIAPPQPSVQPQKPQPQTQPTVEQNTTPRDCSQVTTHSSQQASCLLHNTITKIDLIRQKLALLHIDVGIVQEWLSALAFYCKSINKPEHLQRIISETFDHLFELITKLETILHTEEPFIMVMNPTDATLSDDPYAILSIPYDATDEQIKRHYESKLAENNSDLLHQQLKAAGAHAEKIETRIAQAQLRTATIQDAYDRLTDENLRQQLDRYRLETDEQHAAIKDATLESLERLYTGLHLLVEDGLITELEQFLARYAPTELSLKQQIEEAENKRYEEQRLNSGQLPAPSPMYGNQYGNYGFQPSYYPGGQYYGSPSSGYHAPAASMPQRSNAAGDSSASGGGGTPSAGGGSAASKATDKKPDKKAEKAQEVKKKEADKKKKKEPTKKDSNSIEQLKKDFTQKLTELKDPLNAIVTYSEEASAAELSKQLDFTRQGLHSTLSIPDLQSATKKLFTQSFLKKMVELQKIAERIQKAQAVAPCRSLWQNHFRDHAKAYTFLELAVGALLKTMTTDKSVVERDPWQTIGTYAQAYIAIQTIFAPPPKDGDKKEADAKGNKPEKKPSSKPSGAKEKETTKPVSTLPAELETEVQTVEKMLKGLKNKFAARNITNELVQKIENMLQQAPTDQEIAKKIAETKDAFNPHLKKIKFAETWDSLKYHLPHIQTLIDKVNKPEDKAKINTEIATRISKYAPTIHAIRTLARLLNLNPDILSAPPSSEQPIKNAEPQKAPPEVPKDAPKEAPEKEAELKAEAEAEQDDKDTNAAAEEIAKIMQELLL